MSNYLRRGSSGGAVTNLQVQLNAKLNPPPNLVPDGIFGRMTDAAVRAFQVQNRLNPDGVVGPITQAALDSAQPNGGAGGGGNASMVQKLHALPFIPQPTPTSCWAASTAMMKNSTVPAVIAATPPDMVAPDGGLRNYSGSDQGATGGQRYAMAHGMNSYPPMSWSVGMLVDRLNRGPLMFDMLWNAADYVSGAGSPGHMVVGAGVISDGNPDGSGTLIFIQDPWPPHVGRANWFNYAAWIEQVSTRTYRVFERVS